jgi:hypothetical protein
LITFERVMIDDGGHTVVRTYGKKITCELVTLTYVAFDDAIFHATLFKQYSDFFAIRCWPEVYVNHEISPVELQSGYLASNLPSGKAAVTCSWAPAWLIASYQAANFLDMMWVTIKPCNRYRVCHRSE